MNDKFRFEIVRRGNGRFGWIFVRVGDGKRRLLARSVRDYRSPDKVKDAIDKMDGARVDDTTVGDDPFPLPATSFRIVSGVVPLIVDEFEDEDAAERFTAPFPRAVAAATTQSKASPKPKAQAKPKTQAKRRPARKPKPRRTARRSAA